MDEGGDEGEGGEIGGGEATMMEDGAAHAHGGRDRGRGRDRDGE